MDRARFELDSTISKSKINNDFMECIIVDNDPQVVAEIEAFFEDFAKAYPKDDIGKYLSLFSKDENLVVFGTGEKWVGYEEYKTAPQTQDARRQDGVGGRMSWIRKRIERKIDEAVDRVKQSREYAEAARTVEPIRRSSLPRKRREISDRILECAAMIRYLLRILV